LVQTLATDGEAAAFAPMQAVLDGTLPVFQEPLNVAPGCKTGPPRGRAGFLRYCQGLPQS